MVGVVDAGGGRRLRYRGRDRGGSSLDHCPSGMVDQWEQQYHLVTDKLTGGPHPHAPTGDLHPPALEPFKYESLQEE